MRKFLILIALVVALQLPIATLRAQTGPRLEYVVTVRPEAHAAHVKLLISKLSGKNSLHLHIYKPEWYEEPYVENLSIAGEMRPVIEGFREEGFAWVCEVTTGGAPDLAIEYDVEQLIPSKWSGVYSSYIGSELAVIYSSCLFLTPTFPSSEVRVSFRVPESWGALMPWDEVNGSYKVDGIESLGRRYIVLGPLEKRERMASGVRIVAAGFRESYISLEDWLTGLAQLTDFYSKTFGFVPFDRLTWAIVPPTVASGGRSASNTFLLSEELARRVLEHEFWKTTAHEYCHLWNGGVVSFKDDAQWFLEGGTNYFADLAVLNTNLCRRSKLEIFEAWGDYKSVKEAGMDKAVAEASDPFEDSIWIYKKGELVTYLLNKRIEEVTGSRKNIYDLARYLFQNYQGRSLGTHDILTAANAVTGQDLSDFFLSYVWGTERLPLDELDKWEMAVPKIPDVFPKKKADLVLIAIAVVIIGCALGAAVLLKGKRGIAKGQ
jgi:predicted metalloprotease with PDZ domain